EAEFLGTRSDSKNAPQSLRVAGFSSVTRSILLPALAPLARESAMRLSLLSRELGELPGLLRRGEADLIVVDTEPERDDAEGIFLGYEENVLVRSSHKKSPELFLDHDAEDLTTARYLQKFLPGTKRPERLYLDEIYALLDGVKLGLGQAVLPLHLVRGDKGLSVPHPGKVLRVPVWLQFPRQSYYPRSQREAREAIILHAASVLARK
ncbi:hypothetical protein EB061_11375, partial [bacterium]|nr:hypothetical protein [bacterium]